MIFEILSKISTDSHCHEHLDHKTAKKWSSSLVKFWPKHYQAVPKDLPPRLCERPARAKSLPSTSPSVALMSTPRCPRRKSGQLFIN